GRSPPCLHGRGARAAGPDLTTTVAHGGPPLVSTGVPHIMSRPAAGRVGGVHPHCVKVDHTLPPTVLSAGGAQCASRAGEARLHRQPAPAAREDPSIVVPVAIATRSPSPFTTSAVAIARRRPLCTTAPVATRSRPSAITGTR